MSFTIPNPTGVYHSPRTIAADSGRTEQAVTDAIRDGRIEAINISGRWAIPDTERQRLLRDGWPTRCPQTTKFWNEWRAFRAQRQAASAA